MTSGPQTLNDFYSALGSFVEGAEAVRWKELAPCLCGPGLRRVAALGDDGRAAERCWGLLSEDYFAASVLDFYNAAGRRDEHDELALRLTRNARGLFATAMVAAAARLGAGAAPEAFRWAARAVGALDAGAAELANDAAPRPRESATAEEVLSAVFDALPGGSSPAAAATQSWALHWLNPRASESHQKRWTWIAWVSNGVSGHGAVQVADTGLKHTALVEHPEGALVPAEKDWLDSVTLAWELSGLAGDRRAIAWRALVPPPWLPLSRTSAGAALYVAMSCLRSGRPCDRSRAVLAALPSDGGGLLQPVRSVELKIAALPKDVRAVAVAEDQQLLAGQVNVEVERCDSLEHAAGFASDLVTKMRSFLLAVSAEGADVGRGVSGGPRLEPFLRAAGGAGAGRDDDAGEPAAGARRADRCDTLPARVLVRDLVEGAARRAAVLADGGFGKTQLAWWAAKGVADEAVSALELHEPGARPPHAPLPLDAGDLEAAVMASPPRGGGLSGSQSFDDRAAVGLLGRAAGARYPGHEDVLHYFAESATDVGAGVRVLLIVDNLDRVAAGLREPVYALLRRFASWPCSILLTSREYAFDPAALPNFGVYRIQGLTPGRASRYAAAALKDAPERAAAVSHLLRTDRGVGLLANSPLLLTMVCGVARQLGAFSLTRTALYHNYLLDRLGRPADPLGAQLRLELLQRVGLKWFEEVGPVGEVEGKRLAGWLGGDTVQAYPLTVTPERAGDFLPAALTLRLLGDLVALGLFAPTAPDNGYYRAGHPSIIEFLAGTRLAADIDAGDAKLLAKLADSAPNAGWRDIIPFVAGSLKDPSRLLSEMLRPADPFHLWLFAVAECLVEVGLAADLGAGAEQVARRLVDLLSSPSRVDRDRAVEALGRMGIVWGEVIVRLLGPLVDDPDPDARAAAVEAACAVSAPEHVGLAARYVQERGARRRGDVLRRLSAIAPLSAAEAAQALHSDPDLDVRWAAAEALASTDEGYKRLITQLKVGDGWSRRIASRALLLSEPPEVVAEVRPLLGDAAAAVRAAAVGAVAGLVGRLAPEEWAELASDESPEVRLEVARAPGAGAGQFRMMLRDRNERVTLGAIESLWRSGAGEAPDFEPLLEHPMASVRMKAAAACHALGVEGCLERLVGEVEQDGDATHFALAAIESLREVAAVGPLLGIMRGARSALRLRIVNALGRVGDRRATPTLVGLLESPDPAVQAAAALALGRIGDPEACEPVGALALADTAIVRRAAVDALAMLRDSRAAGPLLDCMLIPDPQLIPKAASALRSSVDLEGLLRALDAHGGARAFALSCPMPWHVYELVYSYVAPGAPGAWSQHSEQFAALTAAIHSELKQTVT